MDGQEVAVEAAEVEVGQAGAAVVATEVVAVATAEVVAEAADS